MFVIIDHVQKLHLLTILTDFSAIMDVWSDPETGLEKEISFQVKEKRIVSYNPSLAQKQKAEIMKMVDKAINYTTYKKIAQEDLGDSVK